MIQPSAIVFEDLSDEESATICGGGVSSGGSGVGPALIGNGVGGGGTGTGVALMGGVGEGGTGPSLYGVGGGGSGGIPVIKVNNLL